MNKKITKTILALLLCLVMCTSVTSVAFAADIPYKNINTTSVSTIAYINTKNFSGYSNTSIGHFSIETQGYSSSCEISVVIYYKNNQIAYYLMSGNGKVERIGINQNFYSPAGQYKIVVSVYNGNPNGWTGVWLYH